MKQTEKIIRKSIGRMTVEFNGQDYSVVITRSMDGDAFINWQNKNLEEISVAKVLCYTAHIAKFGDLGQAEPTESQIIMKPDTIFEDLKEKWVDSYYAFKIVSYGEDDKKQVIELNTEMQNVAESAFEMAKTTHYDMNLIKELRVDLNDKEYEVLHTDLLERFKLFDEDDMGDED